MEPALPAPGIEATQTFVVQDAHTTNVFGPQHSPAGLPAATDAALEEAVGVLGTPHLLARVEFVGRESVRGQIPDGTGVVGEHAEIDHRRAAVVGTEVEVRTILEQVEGQSLVFEGTLREADVEPESVIGTATISLRVVERDRFHGTLV
jgi:fluoroacetyl-CoA thioesterase